MLQAIRTLVILVTASSLAFANQAAPAKEPGVPARSKRPRTTTAAKRAPFNFEQVQRIAESVRKRLIAELDGFNLLQERGLDFEPTEQQVEQLRAAKASPRIVEFMESKVKAVAPPKPVVVEQPPPKPKEGSLTVTCAPVDCSVLINGTVRGTTKLGRVENLKLAPGSVFITVNREGYESDRREVKQLIAPNESHRVDFKLAPTRAALESAGASLLARMLGALGGDAGLRESSFFRGFGVITVYSRDGQTIAPSLTAILKAPDRARFSIVLRGKDKFEVAQGPTGYLWNKKVSGAEFQQIEHAFRLFQEHQLTAWIQDLRGSGLKMVATALEPTGSDTILRAEGNPNSYVIRLDPEFRPKEVKLESTGLNTGLRVLYLDYQRQGATAYPATTQILLPDAPRHGVEVKFDKVELNPAGVKDTDLVLKKGSPLSGK